MTNPITRWLLRRDEYDDPDVQRTLENDMNYYTQEELENIVNSTHKEDDNAD